MSVGIIRGEVAAIATECGLEGEALDDVALAVSEAVTNAVIHGSAGREDALIELVVGVSDVVMLVTVSDNGPGLQPSNETAGLGAGLAIIAALTRCLDIRSTANGTEVRMAFRRPGERRDDDDDRVKQLEEAANGECERARQLLDAALLDQDRLGELLDVKAPASPPRCTPAGKRELAPIGTCSARRRRWGSPGQGKRQGA